ncbi:MAG: cobalamin B12-binding domain-containing protein [Marinilabilia sp.]
MVTNMKQETFLNTLLQGDRSGASRVINDMVEEGSMSVRDLYEEVIKRALYNIGELWEYGKISVATEHLASAIVEMVLNELYYKVMSGDKNDHRVVVSCVENEYHQIGSKMVADVFEMNGWNAFFLGANTPVKELVSFIYDVRPEILALSMSIYFHLPVLEKMLAEVKSSFPGLSVLVGGQAFRHGGRDVVERYPEVKFIADLNALDMFIKDFELSSGPGKKG